MRNFESGGWTILVVAMVAAVLVGLTVVVLQPKILNNNAPPATYGPPVIYYVEKNDTLFAIAQRAVDCGAMRCGSDIREAIDDLDKFNPGLTADLAVGQMILIPITHPRPPDREELFTRLGIRGYELNQNRRFADRTNRWSTVKD